MTYKSSVKLGAIGQVHPDYFVTSTEIKLGKDGSTKTAMEFLHMIGK